jgi:hypothetical protein
VNRQLASKLDVDDMLQERDALENTVLASGASGRRIAPAHEQQLRRVGQQLFDALLSGSVLGTYRASLGVAQQRGEPLRVVLRLTAPQHLPEALATLIAESLIELEWLAQGAQQHGAQPPVGQEACEHDERETREHAQEARVSF